MVILDCVYEGADLSTLLCQRGQSMVPAILMNTAWALVYNTMKKMRFIMMTSLDRGVYMGSTNFWA